MQDIYDSSEEVISYIEKIDFAGKVVVITGAGSGLGKDYALEFSKRGAKVVVNDFGCSTNGMGYGRSDSANNVVKNIKKNGGEAVANYSDISNISGGQSVVNTALDAFGRVDILINNAGILRDKSFAKMNHNDWKAVMDVHLNGVYNVTRPAFKIMKNNGYGKIVMITSASALYGNFGQTNYAAAKMAVIGVMNSLKIEGEKYNININSVAPISASRLTKSIMPEDIFNKAKPNLVTPLVLYLCSDHCLSSGGIYNAGMGYVNRAAIFTNSWIKMFDNNICPSPEEIHYKWNSINNMKNSKEIKNFNDMFMIFLSSLKD